MGGNTSCSACGCNDKQEERPLDLRQRAHREAAGGGYGASSAPPMVMQQASGARDEDDPISFGIPAHTEPHSSPPERHQLESGAGSAVAGQSLPWGLERKESPALSEAGGDYRKEGAGYTQDSSPEQDWNTSAGTDRTHDGRGYPGSWGQATGTPSDTNEAATAHRHEELQDGSVFEGQFRGRDRHGRGRFTWSGGGSYDGQFDSNDMHGEGEYRWPDGSTYHGQWTRNNMGPKGVMQWTDGRKYEGEFMDGKKHGEGCLMWPDGRSYIGQWEAGKQHGIGTTVTGRGLRRQSQWEHGKLVRWLECQPDNGGAPDVGGTPPYGSGGAAQRPGQGGNYPGGRAMFDG